MDLRQTFVRKCLGAWPNDDYFEGMADADLGSCSSGAPSDMRGIH